MHNSTVNTLCEELNIAICIEYQFAVAESHDHDTNLLTSSSGHECTHYSFHSSCSEERNHKVINMALSLSPSLGGLAPSLTQSLTLLSPSLAKLCYNPVWTDRQQ